MPSWEEYVYGVEHRLTEVKRHTDGTTLARYEYDALGRRIHTIEYVDAASGDMLTTPKKTRHVYVGIETIQEYECTVQPPCEAEDWNLAREFLWGDPGRFPEPLAMITHGGEGGGQGGPGVPAGESAYHYLHDVLGSVVGLTDETGTIVERYTYDPYGKPLIEKRDLSTNDWQLTTASAFGNPWLWTGQRHDAATGLYAFLCRTYSPALGRWLQRDPIGYAAGSINLHEYVLGNPLGWIDPLGLAPNQYQAFDPCKMIELIKQWQKDNPDLTIGEILKRLKDYYGWDPSETMDRYFWTDAYGWIDAEHFWTSAWGAYYVGEWASESAGAWVEIGQWIGEHLSKLFGGSPYESGFSYEDIPSDAAGARFGASLAGGGDVADMLNLWLTVHVARPPSDRKTGYDELPPRDPSEPPGGASGGSSGGSGSRYKAKSRG